MLRAQLLGEIREAFDRCQSRYPTIDLPFEIFLARVETVLKGFPEGAEPEDGECGLWLARFSRLQHEDLFLALACAAGNRIAWEYFADEYLPLLRRFALQACRNLERSEDLAQDILADLLGETAGGILERDGGGRHASESPATEPADSLPPGKLGGYSGLGSLASWLRVVVARSAIDRFRRRRPQSSLDELESIGVEVADRVDEEWEPLDARWGRVFSEVLAAEIRRLPARDRLLLSLYYLEGVPLRRIGERFDVHEATASRWLDGVRRVLRKRVERTLRKHHKLRSSDIRSLWRWVSSQEAFSLERVLGEPGARARVEKKVQDEAI